MKAILKTVSISMIIGGLVILWFGLSSL